MANPSPANALIKKRKSRASDELLNYAAQMMKSRGIVDSGDSLQNSIGAMTDARWQVHLQHRDVGAGSLSQTLDVKKAYDLRFVVSASGWR